MARELVHRQHLRSAVQMACKLLVCFSLLIVTVTSQRYSRADDTLFRDQVPSRPPRHKPTVENPFDYDVYFDPAIPPSAHGAPSPLLANNIIKKPSFIPKPFEPRPPKQVKPLQPNGPVLYSTPLDQYGNQVSQDRQDLRNVPGYPGQDYPVFSYVPETTFSCDKVPIRPGLYANQETGCQAYHVCAEDGRDGDKGTPFLCTNGTVFNQELLTCDWWYNVDCQQATRQYEVNLDPYKNPLLYVPEKEEGGIQPTSGGFFVNSARRQRQPSAGFGRF